MISGLILTSIAGFGQRGERNPAEMAAREKTMLLDSINDLTADQKIVINEIYDQYAKDLEKTFAENSGNREEMRASMQSLRKNHHVMLQEILTEEQWAKWQQITRNARERRRARRPQGN